MPTCLHALLSNYMPVTCLPVCLYACMTVRMAICTPGRLSACLCAFQLTNLPAWPGLLTYLLACLLACLSAGLPVS